MRNIIFALLILVLPSQAKCQKWKDFAAFGGGLVAGGAWGLHEVTAHHYGEFQKAFPKANPQFWNPALSWENKHKRNVPAHISDAKHLLASGNQIAIFSTAFVIGSGWKKGGVKKALIRTGLFSAGYFLGNFATYDLIKRQ